MSDYTKTVDFAAKDSLPSGNSGKIIKGTEFETEFDNIATAIATKANLAGPTFTGVLTFASFKGATGATVTTILDEDDMATNSATALATQQSIKAYVDAQQDTVDTLAEILALGNATGGTDIAFGDNDKAIFGAGSDLQIYHSGTHSFIEDKGDGNLYIDGASSVVIRGETANTISAIFNDAGSVVLKNNGDTKLSTTATGIDVTGTATMDGLTVSTATGSASPTATEATISSSTSASDWSTTSAWGVLGFYSADTSGGGAGNRAQISTNMEVATGAYSSLDFTLSNPSNAYAQDSWLKLQNSASSASRKVIVSADGGLDVTGNVHAGGSTSISEAVSGDNNAPTFIVEDSLATSIALLRSDTSIASGNSFGSYAWYGTDTTSNLPRPLAAIQALASGTHSAGDNPTDIRFLVTPDGTESLSEKMRIDSSGNVGIGTSLPDTLAHLAAAGGSTVLRLENTDTGLSDTEVVGKIEFETQDAGGAGVNSYIQAVGQGTGGANKLQFGTGTANSPATRMTIDSSGNVGIGTDSPSSLYAGATNLVVGGGTAESGMTIYSDSTTGNLYFADGTTGAEPYAGYIEYNHASDFLRVGTAGTERVRIDASGNLLMGKTSANNTTQGVTFYATAPGAASFVRDSGNTLVLNRLTTDGEIVAFRKDSATVGRIGVAGGSVYIDGGASNYSLMLASDFRPRTSNGAANNDATVDLGDSQARFKDLYLSGGAHLGGTTAANKLDDYEEGTWTPVYTPSSGSFTTMTMSTPDCFYTKVGRMVTVSGIIRTTDVDVTGASGSVLISGLPFAVASWSAISLGRVQGFAGDMPNSGYGGGSATNINLYYRSTSNGSTTALNVTDMQDGTVSNANYIFLEFTYQTS